MMTLGLLLTGVWGASFRPYLQPLPTQMQQVSTGMKKMRPGRPLSFASTQPFSSAIVSNDTVFETGVVHTEGLIFTSGLAIVGCLTIALMSRRVSFMSTKVYVALTYQRVFVLLWAVLLFYIIPERVAREHHLIGTLVPMSVFFVLAMLGAYFNEGWTLNVDSKLNNWKHSTVFLVFFSMLEAIFVAFACAKTQNFQSGLNVMALQALVAFSLTVYALFIKADFLTQGMLIYVVLGNCVVFFSGILVVGVVLMDYDIDWLSTSLALLYVGIFHSFICYWFRKMSNEEQAFLGREKHGESDIAYTTTMVYVDIVFGWMYCAGALICCTA